MVKYFQKIFLYYQVEADVVLIKNIMMHPWVLSNPTVAPSLSNSTSSKKPQIQKGYLYIWTQQHINITENVI